MSGDSSGRKRYNLFVAMYGPTVRRIHEPFSQRLNFGTQLSLSAVKLKREIFGMRPGVGLAPGGIERQFVNCGLNSLAKIVTGTARCRIRKGGPLTFDFVKDALMQTGQRVVPCGRKGPVELGQELPEAS